MHVVLRLRVAHLPEHGIMITNDGACISQSGEKRNERRRIFAFAKESFNNMDEMHLRMLHTAYCKLTGAKGGAIPRYGSHWEEVGFQGTGTTSVDDIDCGRHMARIRLMIDLSCL